jgi:S-adenosylmethionine hydrolase
MAIITLTTDFGEKDHFVGAVKGAIYTEMEDAKIVDISHSISPFHLHEAAYCGIDGRTLFCVCRQWNNLDAYFGNSP